MWPSWAWLGLITVFFLFSDGYSAEMQRSAELNSLQGNLATQMAAFAYLMKQWLFPLRLNIDPDLPLLHDFSGGLLPLGLFFLLGVSMVMCWRRRPWVSFALAWAMVHLLPLYLLLPRLDIANERQMYLAGWPLFLALSIELALLLNGRMLRVAAAALCVVLATLTVLHNQVYANEITLWEDTVAKSPNKARVHNNLGYAYMQAHRPDEARREFNIALRLDRSQYKAFYNLKRLDDEPGSTDRLAPENKREVHSEPLVRGPSP
jgi:tetratricopeptide (TPR) repeat protein